MYLMVCTTPNLPHVVSTLSRFMTNPDPNYWEPLKWLFIYLRGTYNVGLVYKHYIDSVKLKVQVCVHFVGPIL